MAYDLIILLQAYMRRDESAFAKLDAMSTVFDLHALRANLRLLSPSRDYKTLYTELKSHLSSTVTVTETNFLSYCYLALSCWLIGDIDQAKNVGELLLQHRTAHFFLQGLLHQLLKPARIEIDFNNEMSLPAISIGSFRRNTAAEMKRVTALIHNNPHLEEIYIYDISRLNTTDITHLTQALSAHTGPAIKLILEQWNGESLGNLFSVISSLEVRGFIYSHNFALQLVPHLASLRSLKVRGNIDDEQEDLLRNAAQQSKTMEEFKVNEVSGVQAPVVPRTRANQRRNSQWEPLFLSTAFVRASYDNPYRTAILPLIPTIMGFASDSKRNYDSKLTQSFMNTRFFKACTGANSLSTDGMDSDDGLTTDNEHVHVVPGGPSFTTT